MNSLNNGLYKINRVSPFRYLRIKACLPAPRSFSQASTSFIAFDCQGIHLLRLITWFENPTRYFLVNLRVLIYFYSESFSTLMYFVYNALLKSNTNLIKSIDLISLLSFFLYPFQARLNASPSTTFANVIVLKFLSFWFFSLNATYPILLIQYLSFLEDHKKRFNSFYIFAPSYRFLSC